LIKVLGKRLNRLVSCGGYLSGELSRELHEIGITAAQGYGMSECSPASVSLLAYKPEIYHIP